VSVAKYYSGRPPGAGHEDNPQFGALRAARVRNGDPAMTCSDRARRLTAALLAAASLCGSARAADSEEFWPELSVYYGLNPRARVYGDAAVAKGLESDEHSLDLSLCLDVSLKPILRKDLLAQDWQRSRYLWARVGYTWLSKVSQGTVTRAENRGVVALYGKAPLPAEIWLEGRARVDLRWIGEDYATRYRARLEATREFSVHDHAVVPYLNYEWFYDTRYDGWARTLWMADAEVTMSEQFRYEVYLAGQKDRLPDEESLGALGVVAKWYY